MSPPSTIAGWHLLPLIGTTKVSRYREAAQALDLELTAEQLTALDAA